MSNFKGKRMVSEDLIKKLEDLEPGGGTEYTAGTGIEISDEDVISVDTDTVALKTDIPEGALVLTQATGTLSDDDYAKLDENTIIQYNDSSITRLYYFYSDTTTQIEYRTNPIFTNSTTGSAYRFIVTKADKTYGLNYSLGYNLLPTMSSNGNFKLTASRSGSTVTAPNWKLDYPDPDTTTAGSYNLEATVDAQGGITYDWATGGSGSSYTFTDGLTESGGTVSWDLNDNIIKENNGLVLKTYSTNNITNESGPNLVFGYTSNTNDSIIHTTGLGSLAFGYAGFSTQFNYGEIKSSGSGSLAFGRAGTSSVGDEGKIIVNGQNSGNGLAFGNTTKGTIEAGYNGNGFNIAGGVISGSLYTHITASGKGSIAYGVTDSTIGDIVSSGEASIAIGRGVQATGFDSIALGYKSTSSGAQSEAHGFRTKASGAQQFVIGKDNIEDSAGTYAFIIGNGTADNARSNAMTVSKDGTIVSKNLPAVDTTTDGTYVLKATVSNGAVTYAWVLES